MRGYGQFDEEIFEHEKLNSKEEYQKWKQDTKEKLSKLDELVGEEYKIPPITHAVYFTSNEEPKPMKPLYLSKYINTSTRLSLEDQNFKHFIWTNNPAVIAAEVKNLPGVEVRLCQEFKEHPLYTNLISLLEKSQLDSRKFVEASDVARVMAVQKHGGIYHDLDYEVYDAKAMISFMKAFEHFNAKEAERWDSSIGNAFIANAPYHPVINKTAQILKRNLNQDENTPDYVKYPKNKFDGVIAQTGPVAITMANYLVGSKGGIIFPDKIIYNADYARNPSSTELPKSNFEGIEIKTVGGDMFSGSWGTSDYLQDIYYDYVPGRKMDIREMQLSFTRAIKNNQLEKVDQLLLHQNDRWVLNEALLVAINSKNIEIFNKILDKFDGNLSDSLRAVARENNLEMLNILLARIVDEEILYEGIGIAIDNGNQEIFKIILEKIHKTSLLNKAFNRAINKDQLIIFKELLPKVSDETTLNQALWETASTNKKAMFELILPMVNDQQTITSTLRDMINSYHHNEEMLDSFLLTLEQAVIGQALCDMVNNDNSKFDYILAKVTDQEWLGKALKLTLDNYRSEEFEKILLKVTNQETLNELLKLTAGQLSPEKFDKILSKVTCQETLKEALSIAAEYDRGNKVMKLLKMSPEVSQEKIEQIFDQALMESHSNVVKELLPQIIDQNRLEQALSLSIKNKNTAIINSLIDRIDKAELFDELLIYFLEKTYNQSISDEAAYQISYCDTLGSSLRGWCDTIRQNSGWNSPASRAANFKANTLFKETFFKLLAKNNNQKELGEALSYSMEKYQHPMSKAIIDKITDQEILNTAFTNFIWEATKLSWTNFQLTKDQKELCNKFLPKVTDQKALIHSFSYINDQAILDVLFSKITDQNQIDLGKALSFVCYNNEDKFNKLLLKLSDQSALVEVLSDLFNSRHCNHLIDRVLLKITEEKYFAEIVKKSIEHNREELAETYLEKVTEQKSLEEIFTCAIRKNNNHLTDQILLKITEEKYFAGIVKKAIEHDKKELAEKYLEKVTEQKSLEEIFT